MSESLNLSQSIRDLSEAHSTANTSLGHSAVVASAAFSLVDKVGTVTGAVHLCLSSNTWLGGTESESAQKSFLPNVYLCTEQS